jgi:hypothetical protein
MDGSDKKSDSDVYEEDDMPADRVTYVCWHALIGKYLRDGDIAARTLAKRLSEIDASFSDDILQDEATSTSCFEALESLLLVIRDPMFLSDALTAISEICKRYGLKRTMGLPRHVPLSCPLD